MTVRETWNMRCPQCNSDEQVCIEVAINVKLRADGTEALPGNHAWDEDGFAFCNACRFDGQVSDFRIPVAPSGSGRIELRIALDHAAAALSLLDTRLSEATDAHLKSAATNALLDKLVDFSAKHGIKVVIERK